MTSDSRVTVLIRPVDRLLIAVRVGLVPTLALAAAVPALLGLMKSFRPTDLVVGIVAPLIAALYILALQGHELARPIDRRLAKVRRRVATGCNHDEWTDHEDHRLACMLTAEVFRAPLFEHDSQRKVVSALLEACGSDPSGRYWFVEGRSGSGKTRTALQLVQNLTRDHDLFELGNRCHLYDFSGSKKAQSTLLRRLGTSSHEGAIVLVDNFHLVDTEVLKTLTRRIIEGSRKPSERLLVFLARPGEAWSLGSGSDVRLLSEAKTRDRYLELFAPASETVANRVFDVDEGASQLIRNLRQDYVASATQLHLAQVIARNRAVLPEVRDMMQVLADAQSASTSPQLVELLAILSGLAMHRGSFSRRELRRALRAVRRARRGASGLADTLRMRRRFRRLHRIGVVPKIHLDGTRYLFHETIAELCIDRLSRVPTFRQPFVAVGRMRLRAAHVAHQVLDVWLVGTEIDDEETVEENFDGALSQGAYGRMTRCLERAKGRHVLSAPTQLQLAILLDRTGDFEASRKEFTADLADALRDSNELGAILATTRLEASHDEASMRELEALRTSSDRLLAIVGEYWQVHISAHHGEFAAPRLLDLASEARGLVAGRESHWTTHSIARMHFDSLRHHYLEGGLPAGAIGSPQRLVLNDYLRTRLPTYEAFHALYARAHLVGHVLLPQLAIFKQSVSGEDAQLTGVDRDHAREPGTLAAIALDLYRHARDEFWQYGDREARYLQADLLNAAMIQDDANLDGLLVDLHDYKRFIDETGFKTIASYPHFYFFRWSLLKRYELILRGTSEPREADELLASARREVERITILDAGVNNEYGMLRAELLGLLLDAVEGHHKVAELQALGERMAARGYLSEQRLLRLLVESGSLKLADLRAIVRFYPFVHQ